MRNNVRKLADFIADDPHFCREMSSLAFQLIKKFERHEGIEVRIRSETSIALRINELLQYDIKELIWNIVRSAADNYRIRVDRSFILNEEQENTLIEKLYKSLGTAILDDIVGSWITNEKH